MGRRNTQLKTTYREKQTLKPLAKVSQPERYTGKILIERDPTDWLLSGTLLESMLWKVLHRPFEPARLTRVEKPSIEIGRFSRSQSHLLHDVNRLRKLRSFRISRNSIAKL